MSMGRFRFRSASRSRDVKALPISAVHNALHLIAILLASLSIGGLLLVLLLLFRVERDSAGAQTRRRED